MLCGGGENSVSLRRIFPVDDHRVGAVVPPQPRQEGADRLAATLPDHIAQHDDYHSFFPSSFVSSTDSTAEPNNADSAAERSAGSGARAETVCPAGPVRNILQQCSACRVMGPQSPP